MLLRIGGSALIVGVLSGCGNIAAVKSFSTKFESPADGETANLRVISNAMVRGVPDSECIDWYLPGAGVIVAKKGFANRNGESLGMPDSKWTSTSSGQNFYSTELKVIAGKPLTLAFLGFGGVDHHGSHYVRWQCVGNDVFIPKPGHNYEYVAIENGRSCQYRLVEYLNAVQEEKIETKSAPFCKRWHYF